MKKVIILSICLLAVLGADCQNSPMPSSPMVADRIVAIVGNKIILASDIDQQYDQLSKDAVNPLPPTAKCAILEQLMDEKALDLQAEIDSLPVSDDDVEGTLDNRIRYFINLYGSREKLEQVAGKSIYQIKETYRPGIKENLLAEAERKKILDEVKITPEEVKNYFDAIPKDSLPFFPSQIEVGIIVINPKPTQEMENYTINQLETYRKQIVDGQYSFQTIMLLYSKDPSRNQNDGVFPITRTDQNMDQNFLEAAFRLHDGEISPVIKSQFGYHLIQMVHREGDNATVRHILIPPPITEQDIVDAETRLDSLRTAVLSKTISFGEAASRFSEDPNAKLFAGMMTDPEGSTYLTAEELEPAVLLTVDSLKMGEFSHPTTFSDTRGNTSTRVIYLKSRTKPHQENLTDDYAVIQDKALVIKQNQELNKWFDKMMPQFYIMVVPDFQKCASPARWLQYAAKTQAGLDAKK